MNKILFCSLVLLVVVAVVLDSAEAKRGARRKRCSAVTTKQQRLNCPVLRLRVVRGVRRLGLKVSRRITVRGPKHCRRLCRRSCNCFAASFRFKVKGSRRRICYLHRFTKKPLFKFRPRWREFLLQCCRRRRGNGGGDKEEGDQDEKDEEEGEKEDNDEDNDGDGDEEKSGSCAEKDNGPIPCFYPTNAEERKCEGRRLSYDYEKGHYVVSHGFGGYSHEQTKDDCYEKCKANEKCFSADYMPGHKRCYLNSFYGGTFTPSKNDDLIRLKCCPIEKPPTNVGKCIFPKTAEERQCEDGQLSYDYEEGHYVVSHGLGESHQETKDDCYAKCKDNDKCFSADYMPGKKRCFLNSFYGGTFTPSKVDNLIRLKCCTNK